MAQSPSLSVVINTKNSEKFLLEALTSAQFADELIVVDMQSSDKTKKIASTFTKKIYDFDDVGYVEPARNYALQKATSDWVFVLDADEEISSSLQEKIKELISLQAFDAYYIPRLNEVFGHEMQRTGWWPDYQLRLFKRGVVVWKDTIHSVPTISGSSDYLSAAPQHAILHHNYQNISQFVERMNRYTSITADALPPTNTTPTAVIRAFKEEFFRRLFYHKGISEGVHGVSLSYLQGMYEVLVVLKQWERAGHTQTTADEAETLAALREFQKELYFWISTTRSQSGNFLQKFLAKLARKVLG